LEEMGDELYEVEDDQDSSKKCMDHVAEVVGGQSFPKKWMATTKPNANQDAKVGFFQVWSSKITNAPSHDIMRRFQRYRQHSG
jgi:hypothetical protein